MKKMMTCVVFLVPALLWAQTEKPIESKISQVTVFLNKAQVTREAKVRIDAGKTNLIVRGLTAQLDQQSIQVAGKGNFIILGIAHQQNYLSEFNTPPALARLKDSLEHVQRQVSFENSRKEILNKEEQMLLSNQRIGGTAQNLTAAELKSMADLYRTRLTDIVSSRMNLDLSIKKLNEKLTRLLRQVQEQTDLYSGNTSEIVISVSADASTQAELTVSYVVANAGWNAVYDIRSVGSKSPLNLQYKANVFQNTGEEWPNVKLKLSTANPALGGLKPELYTWYLNFYRPQYNAAKQKLSAMGAVHRSTAAPAEDDMAEVVVAEERPAGEVSQFVNTVQTALNTEFEIGLPYTVSSSNKPTLVEIRSHEIQADYIYSAAPKLDADAFLLARATGWEALSLLPGEANVFFEGTFVGKTFVDPNSIKDTLNVSLGRDKRVVVKREKLRDFSSRKTIGSNQRESVAYELSVRNTKNEVIRMTLEDQFPVSQNSQIEVTLADAGGAKVNAATGKLTWELEVQPNETKKVVYKYEVKYPKDQIISGLN